MAKRSFTHKGVTYTEADYDTPEEFDSAYRKYSGTSAPVAKQDISVTPKVRQTYGQQATFPYSTGNPAGVTIRTVLQDLLRHAGGGIINHLIDVDMPNVGGYNTTLGEGLTDTGLALATAAIPGAAGARAAKRAVTHNRLAKEIPVSLSRQNMLDLRHGMLNSRSPSEFRKYGTEGVASQPYHGGVFESVRPQRIPYRTVTNTTPERFVLDTRVSTGIDAGNSANTEMFKYNKKTNSYVPVTKKETGGSRTGQTTRESYRRIPEATTETIERIPGADTYDPITDETLLKLYNDNSANVQLLKSAQSLRELHERANQLRFKLGSAGAAMVDEYERALQQLFRNTQSERAVANDIFGARKDIIKDLSTGIQSGEKAAIGTNVKRNNTFINHFIRNDDPAPIEVLENAINPRNYRLRQDIMTTPLIPVVKAPITPLFHDRDDVTIEPLEKLAEY